MDRRRDIEAILARRSHNGGDFWASADNRIYVGHPFSTLGALGMLHEMGVGAEHEAVLGGLDLILNAACEDGRIRLAPKAPLYPCYTAEAARILCRFGLADHEAVRRTAAYLLENVHETGGWRCNYTKLGRGPGTEFANPGATLFALDTLRYYAEYRDNVLDIDHAVESLLSHWETRAPLGPCQYGIGTLFLQVEFPFLRYNLFYYVYVLSFFNHARQDARFHEALAELTGKLNERGEIIVERPHRALKEFAFCARGLPSAAATARYREIMQNLG